MCGFFITNFRNGIADHEDIINKCLSFRGPDGNSGLIENNGWTSYHSRLSIIDPKSGINQPVINADGSQLVFNGEILNYKELGVKYFQKDYESDTVLLNDLILESKLVLAELDGFFAFVFVDGDGILKYACRDRFGVKPLFYFKDENQYAFSSEPSVLKNIFNCPVDKEAIEEYKLFRAPIFKGTFFKNVNQIEPGYCFENGCYFDLDRDLLENRESEPLEDALRKGISTRCVSDVPVGLLLSKGVDSNLVRQYGTFDRFYSIGFTGDPDYEYLKNSDVKNLTLKSVTNEEFKKAFEHLLALRQEPLSVPNEVLLFIIATRAAKDGVKVLLSGEGADEFFGGYDRIFTWAAHSEKFDVKKFLELYTYASIEGFSSVLGKVEELFRESPFSLPFDQVRWFFIKYHLPILFRRLDFSLMAGGVEGREPLANKYLFDVAKNYSADCLMVSNIGKQPLRELLAKKMGSSFAFENKVGFPVDIKSIYEDMSSSSSYDIWFEKNLEIL
jgi:asparagine synthase (glutamine-hydrolysing)